MRGTKKGFKTLAKQLATYLDKLSPRQAAYVFTAVGVATFFTGLRNPFQGDDNYQIVQNVPVHSLSHIVLFFKSSTFYNGQQLTGDYYRPLMTTVFSLIYTFFGAHPMMYHVMQLGLYIAAAFLLYLIFKRFMKPWLALGLGLLFLVHPLNSQVVYSIPTMQDALFFFFGLLALWTLMAYQSKRSLWAVTGWLFLALLSKETALVFVVLALLYLLLFDRKRFRWLLLMVIVPVAAYVFLKIYAVGLNAHQHAAPIDDASLAVRLYTAPSIAWFYITKAIFPWKLASGYYWLDPKFSVRHVLLPALGDLAVLALIAVGGWRLKKRGPKMAFYAYLFFAAWAVFAVVPYLQIVPLDMTFCESWFYFSLAGMLGLIGLALSSFKGRLPVGWVMVVLTVLIVAFGARSGIRGSDYRSQYALAQHDVAASPQDYSAMSNISEELINRGQYKQAAAYAQRSIDVYPVTTNWVNLGVARENMGDYNGTIMAYGQALKYGNLSITYENLALLYLAYRDPADTAKFFRVAFSQYPQDFKLWVYLAVFEAALGRTDDAKAAIQTATKYGSVPQPIYDAITKNQPLVIPILGKSILI